MPLISFFTRGNGISLDHSLRIRENRVSSAYPMDEIHGWIGWSRICAGVQTTYSRCKTNRGGIQVKRKLDGLEEGRQAHNLKNGRSKLPSATYDSHFWPFCLPVRFFYAVPLFASALAFLLVRTRYMEFSEHTGFVGWEIKHFECMKEFCLSFGQGIPF